MGLIELLLPCPQAPRFGLQQTMNVVEVGSRSRREVTIVAWPANDGPLNRQHTDEVYNSYVCGAT